MSEILDNAVGRAPDPAPTRPTPKPGILDISAYVGGKARAEGFAEPVKLSSNENALGCSPQAAAAFTAAASRLHLYPDGRVNALRTAISETFDLEPDRLVFGCGSDELFSLTCQVYCQPGDNVVQGEHGFLAFRIAARAAQAEVRFAAEPDLRVDVDRLLALVDERTRVVFLANPSNPTGTFNRRAEIERLHQGLPPNVLLILDGAYAEFVTDPDYTDGLDMARRSENILVTRTFSKIHGLANLRVGWGYGVAAVVEAIERIRPPFNVNGPGEAAAIAALRDTDFVKRSLELVATWRPWLAQQLGGLGLEVTPSQTNFVLARFPHTPGRTAAEAESFLAERHGVLVRGLKAYGLGDALRITVGLEAQNRAVVDGLTAFLAQSA